MTTIILSASAIVAVFAIIWLLRHHRRRARLYRALADDRARTVARQLPGITRASVPAALCADFQRHHLAAVADFLDTDTLAKLQAECRSNQALAIRSYLPAHKQGGTLSYEQVHTLSPAALGLYHSADLQRWLGELTGLELRPTADHDQSSCSVLYYDRAGDHIGWHRDHNFYRGRHFTVLLSVINRAPDGSPSGGQLQRRQLGEVIPVATPENTLVVFEGARVLHRATRIGEDEQRIMLSMTFCTDPRVHPTRELIRRIKDSAYYGPRVLFD